MALTLRLPEDLESALEERCALTGAGKTAVVVLALRHYLRGASVWSESALDAAIAASPVPVVRASELGGKEFRGPDPRVK